MSCPYFDPVTPRSPGDPATSMLPLGDRWAGACLAIPAEPYSPDEPSLATLCNLGYARESCSRFPRAEGPDAVRFTVAAASPEAVDLYYVIERDHHPFAHGPLTYRLPDGPFTPAPASETLAAQARAYIASFLHRKQAAARR